jgi:predicted enzyme related to lactoylglutathione lyase
MTKNQLRKGASIMIDHVGTVSIFVNDQDRAKDFYTNVLGFELRADAPLFPGAAARWLAVAPTGATTEIILYLPDENWEHYKQVVGKSQALTFNVTGMAAVHADLKAKGVTFVQEPDEQPWGTYAIIQDSEGNHLILVEQPTN